MLCRTAEYALRAIVWLSNHPESSITGQVLAATQVPADYLALVMQSLVRGGLVEAHRGKNGGFSIVSAPENVTILDVINAVEPIRRIRTCPLGLAGHESLCPLHRSLDNIAGQLERAYGTIRIADLLRSGGAKPLCPVTEATHA
jgi:Rrf2 family nitric oxide-sensitive transcriptional repressor